MTSRSLRLFFGLSVGSAVTVIAACSVDHGAINFYISDDASTKKDAFGVLTPDDGDGGLTCPPVTPASITFSGPPTGYQNKCSAAEINSLLDACNAATSSLDDPTCTAARKQTATCASCLYGAPQDATGHAFIVYQQYGFPIIDRAVCMSALTNETAAADCPSQYGLLDRCEFLSCLPGCAAAQGSSADVSACRTATQTTTCAVQIQAIASSTCAMKLTNGGAYDFCFPDPAPTSDVDYRKFETAVANLVCGAPPADAGSDGGNVDGGPDAEAGAPQ